MGDTAEAAGVTGVVGAWEELSLGAPPDEGVAAADWLRELRRTEVKTEDVLADAFEGGTPQGVSASSLTWMRSCWWLVLRCPASWQVQVQLALPDLLTQTQRNQFPVHLRPFNNKQTSAHPVLPVLSVRSAASAGCGSCFPAGSEGLLHRRAPTARGRRRLRCLALQEWEDCSGTRSPCDSTLRPCRSLAPDGRGRVGQHQKRHVKKVQN